MAKPDAYESGYMANDGVVMRDKRVSPRSFQILSFIPIVIFGLLGLGAAGAALFAAGSATRPALWAAGAALMTALFAFSWVSFAVLRTVLTNDELHIQCGFAGPRIAIDRITSVEVKTQKGRIRVGKRWEGDMWASDYLYSFGEYVEVVWTNARGKPQRVRFTPSDPHGVAAAIERVRSGAHVRAETERARFAPDKAASDDVPPDHAEEREETEARAER
jgi:hypothetical protein